MWIIKGNIFQVKVDCPTPLPSFIKREIAEGVHRAFELYLELGKIAEDARNYIGLYFLPDHFCTLIGFTGSQCSEIDPETGEFYYEWEDFKDEVAAIVISTLSDFGMAFPVIINDLTHAI